MDARPLGRAYKYKNGEYNMTMMGEYNHHLSKTHTCVCRSMAEKGHKPCSAIAVRHPFLYYSGYDTAR